ncbi:MAG: hypothetical protein V8S32_01880 [Lachnospiraceae bacterium]
MLEIMWPLLDASRESCYGPMVELFGREILREDGTIDRMKVGGHCIFQ